MTSSSVNSSRKKFERLARLAIIVFLIAVGCACFLIRISSAVQANGVVLSNGQNHILQHPDGGQVIEVIAADGLRVSVGDILLRLDGTELFAERKRLQYRQMELSTQLRRFDAAISGESYFSTISLRGRDSSVSDLERIEQRHTKALAAERALLIAQIEQAIARAEGAEKSLIALRTQRETALKRAELIEEEISPLRDLVADKLVPQSRVARLEREQLDNTQRLQALNLEDLSLINTARDARKEAKALQARETDRLWSERALASNELADILAQLDSIEAQISRLEVTAPIDGFVHEVAAINPGVVLQPGDAALQIVPIGEARQVTVQIPAADIDDIETGQTARVRFDTYRHLNIPEIPAIITSLAADRSVDPVSGEPFFSAVVTLEEDDTIDFDKLSAGAGVPVTVLVETRRRSLASYLVQPAKDAFARTFREN